MDRDGIKLLLEPSSSYRLPKSASLSCGRRRATTAKNRRVQIGFEEGSGLDDRDSAPSTQKAVADELMRIWIRERAKEAMKIEREKLQEEPKHPRESLLAEKVDSGEDLLVALSQ